MLNHTTIVIVVVILAASISWFVFQPTTDFDGQIVVDDMAYIPISMLNKDVKIAIIGSGIGGSSAAYFLKKHFGSKVGIHVYEQADKVGGRLGVAKCAGEMFEAGGSIIHTSNKYMVRFVNELGLKTNLISNRGRFGIYDGKEFVFTEGTDSFHTKLKMIMRYGFFSLWYLSQSLSNMLSSFVNIYKLQDEGSAFETVPEMLKSIGGDSFYNYTQRTAEEVMLENGLGKLLIEELVTGVTRNNYGQDTKVNAFTGYVSMAGAQGGSLFNVHGGNYQVPKKLLQLANATVLLNQHISSIYKGEKDGNTVYFLHEKLNPNIRKVTEDDGTVLLLSEKEDIAYDAVIIASPLEVPNDYITCEGCKHWPDNVGLGHYQQTIATFVQADINMTHFNINDKEHAPTDIFTTETPVNLFSSIGKQYNVMGEDVKPNIYKVFSRTPLDDSTLKELFQLHPKHHKSITWLAYPHYSPPEKFSPFVLDDGVFYVNAIERAASAMEMSAIGGRNAALLAKKYFENTNRVILSF